VVFIGHGEAGIAVTAATVVEMHRHRGLCPGRES
jgi:hypothetical protein